MIGAFVAFSVLVAAGFSAEPEILSKNGDLASKLPAEAWKGPGAWQVQGLRIATGHSTAVDALGVTKGREIEEKAALDDARHQLLAAALPEQDRDFFDLKGEVKAARTAAVYRLPGRQGLFAVLVAQEKDVQAQAVLNAPRARSQAKALMAAGEFARAAKLLGRLTELGVQDAETLDDARAASAEVNLRAGVQGQTASTAWDFLGDYYERHNDLENSLKARHQLYLMTKQPERSLLEKLADLSTRTHRPNSAASFQQEILRRWPPPTPKP